MSAGRIQSINDGVFIMGIKILAKAKDGGPKSPVDAYFLIEWKSVFSIAILKFHKGMREQYHTHAFNALTWFISGHLVEDNFGGLPYVYGRGIIPKVTKREKCHRVMATKDSWCLTIRGPWVKYWSEVDAETKTKNTFTNGRVLTTTEKIL